MVSKAKLKDDPVRYWTECLAQERKAHEKFRKAAKESQKAALDEGSKPHTFNIHWSNCKITAASLYAKPPKADVRRRFHKPDPEEKELAIAVERGLDYSIDTGAFAPAARAIVSDFSKTGLGVPRVVYEVETGPVDLTPEAAEAMMAMGMEPPEEIKLQTVDIEHVPWSCFAWEPGHSAWKNVGWVAFKTYMAQKQAEREFDLKMSGGSEDADKREASKYGSEVEIFEIWHKPTRRIYVITPSHDEPLEIRKDELGLQGFFPCPRPMFDNLKTDELIPKPDYVFVKSQIAELQRIAQERRALAKKIRPVRMCDAKDIQKVESVVNTMGGGVVPIQSMVERMSEAGGQLIQALPIDDLVNGLAVMDEQLESVKQQVYEIIGISDLVRGTTKASETATSQQLKSNYGNMRMTEKQSEVDECFRSVLKIMAEIICEQFQPNQVTLMTGVQLTPRMVEMMRSDIGRSYAIDIETDSTIITDDQAERQQKLELVGQIMEKLSNLIPMVQGGQITPDFASELLSFSIQNYKGAKQLEDAIQGLAPHIQGLQQFQQQMQQLQQQLQQQGQILQGTQQQLQQAQGQLQQVNMREEARKDREANRKDADVQAEVRLDNAKAAEIEQSIQQRAMVPELTIL